MANSAHLISAIPLLGAIALIPLDKAMGQIKRVFYARFMKADLAICISLVGRFLIPPHCFGVVLLYTFAVFITTPEAILGGGISLVGSFLEQPYSLPVVLLNPLEFIRQFPRLAINKFLRLPTNQRLQILDQLKETAGTLYKQTHMTSKDPALELWTNYSNVLKLGIAVG